MDLAGSERVSKTRADGKILQEAKHINLSLHHLEHVIVMLQTHLKSSQFSLSPSSTPSANLSTRKSREGRVESPHMLKLPGSLIPSSNSAVWGSRRGHVPYRNCMLTMVLKDSLGKLSCSPVYVNVLCCILFVLFAYTYECRWQLFDCNDSYDIS